MNKNVHFGHVLHFCDLAYERDRVQRVKIGGLQPEFAFHQIVSQKIKIRQGPMATTGSCTGRLGSFWRTLLAPLRHAHRDKAALFKDSLEIREKRRQNSKTENGVQEFWLESHFVFMRGVDKLSVFVDFCCAVSWNALQSPHARDPATRGKCCSHFAGVWAADQYLAQVKQVPRCSEPGAAVSVKWFGGEIPRMVLEPSSFDAWHAIKSNRHNMAMLKQRLERRREQFRVHYEGDSTEKADEPMTETLNQSLLDDGGTKCLLSVLEINSLLGRFDKKRKRRKLNTALTADCAEFLLNKPSAIQSESKKLGEEIQALLNHKSAREKTIIENLKSNKTAQVREFCEWVTKHECKRGNVKNGSCKKLHFRTYSQMKCHLSYNEARYAGFVFVRYAHVSCKGDCVKPNLNLSLPRKVDIRTHGRSARGLLLFKHLFSHGNLQDSQTQTLNLRSISPSLSTSTSFVSFSKDIGHTTEVNLASQINFPTRPNPPSPQYVHYEIDEEDQKEHMRMRQRQAASVRAKNSAAMLVSDSKNLAMTKANLTPPQWIQCDMSWRCENMPFLYYVELLTINMT
eukprot:sb/3463453/